MAAQQAWENLQFRSSGLANHAGDLHGLRTEFAAFRLC